MKKFEKGQTFQAGELVDYAEDGVVSKELVHNDAGSGLSEHTAPFDALLQVLDGEMELTVSGVRHVVTAGRCFVIPSGAPHSVHAGRRFKMMITMIRG